MMITTSWPESDSGMVQNNIENEIDILMDVISTVRNIRASLNVSPKKEADLIIRGDVATCTILSKYEDYIQRLTTLNFISLKFLNSLQIYFIIWGLAYLRLYFMLVAI